MAALAHSADEIIARYNDPNDDDLFGAFRGSLLDGLPFEAARPLLVDTATAGEWKADGSRAHVIAAARDYMTFAKDKAENHRGLSASRSLDHFRAWLWLLGIDDRVDWDDYRPYGAPVLKQISQLLEMGWPHTDDSDLGRMGNGKPCSDHCDEC